MDSKTDLQMHKAEINANKSISKLQDSLSDLADKIEKPSQRIRTVRRGIQKTKSLPWREIAMAAGAIFLMFRIKHYVTTIPKHK